MSIGSNLERLAKSRKKQEKWLTTRMWFSTAMSLIFQDRGVIPGNIGNNVFIGNNQYITKNSISAVILIRELSEDTDIGFIDILTREVKLKVPGTIIDMTIKNSRYKPDLKDVGLINREKQWSRVLNGALTSVRQKTRVARLLYTVTVAKKREKLFKSHIYITIRSDRGTKLATAIRTAVEYLDRCSINKLVIKVDLKTHVHYFALLCNIKMPKLRDVPTNVMSTTTLAEILPSIQDMNDASGLMLGMDRSNMSPYFCNVKGSAAAKNVWFIAPSGKGKTFMTEGWNIDFWADHGCLSISDIKGTDYGEMVTALGGVTISMRSENTEFVNTFVLDPHVSGDPLVYYNEMFKINKKLLGIIADYSNESLSRGESILEEFLNYIYSILGVLPENKNTWFRTSSLHPYKIFDMYSDFLSEGIRAKYPLIADNTYDRFKIYLWRHGSNSHMFLKPFVISEIVKNNIIRFDFGILNATGVKDAVTVRIKQLFQVIINAEFSRTKKLEGLWVMKTDEEAQVVGDEVIKAYAEDMSLGRSQNQWNTIISNSHKTVGNEIYFDIIKDNVNILVIGAVPKTTREFLIEEYGLEAEREKLDKIATDPEYEYSFLIVNRMHGKTTTAIIKSYVPKEVVDGKLFKNVDVQRKVV